MNSNRNAVAIMTVLTAVLAGCASQAPTEAAFGSAVREVTMKQIHDIGSTLESDPEAVVGADPYQLENVINAHRERSAPSGQTATGSASGSGNLR